MEWKEVSSRLMWVKVKFGRELWMFTYAYGSEMDETEREAFYNDLDDCLQSFGVNVNIVLLGKLNARVGDEVVEDLVGRHDVTWGNENGERKVELCVERELMVGNAYVQEEGYTKVYMDDTIQYVEEL